MAHGTAKLNDDERLEVMQRLNDLRKAGWSNNTLRLALKYNANSAIQHAISTGGMTRSKLKVLRTLDGQKPPRKRYERAQSSPTLQLDTSVLETPAIHSKMPSPAQPPSTNVVGILGLLDQARQDVSRAITTLKKAEDNANPLLRPGIIQQIDRLASVQNTLYLK